MNKLLILDGISGVPLAREMADAFIEAGVQTNYTDLAAMQKLRFYKIRSIFAKLINRANKDSIFYSLPRLNLDVFKKLIEIEQPSHVLVVGFVYKFISPQILKEIKSKNHFSLYLYDTDSCNLYSKRREFIFFLDNELPIYDTIFSFSKVTTNFFRQTRKLNAEHFPFGAIVQQQKSLEKKHDVLFVGSGDLRRIFLLEHIQQVVAIYGNRWERHYPLISGQLRVRISDQSIWGENLYDLLRSAKIVLNITRTHFYGAETGVNLRIFEALSLGCFLLTDYCDEIAELFEIGEEIEVFRSASELKEKVEYYLANPVARERIAKKGYEKFCNTYTWSSRVRELGKTIEVF